MSSRRVHTRFHPNELVRGAGPIPTVGRMTAITSTTYSPHLEQPIGLALLKRGRARLGETLYACSPLQNQTVAVEVAHPVFIDPEGERLHA